MKTMQRIKLASDEAASRKGFVLAMLLLVPFTLLAPQSPRGAETFAARSAPTLTVTIGWDHSSAADGFRVYLRRAGVNYSSSQDAGTNRVFRFTGLQRKTTYKCVVTAYINGYESAWSGELSFRTGHNQNEPPEELQ